MLTMLRYGNEETELEIEIPTNIYEIIRERGSVGVEES